MLTEDQVLDLLSAAIAYDNRNPTEAQIHAWSEAAYRGRWTFAEALDALHEHYATTTEFVMPGHITEAIKARRQQPPKSDWRRSIEGPPPADAQHIGDVMAEVAKKLGWKFEPERREARLYRDCPRCGARAGEPCTRPSKWSPAGRATTTTVHPARLEES